MKKVAKRYPGSFWRLVHQLALVLLIFFSTQSNVFATGQQPTMQDIQYYYLAIKGGVSLGSYESGLNWVLMKQLEADPNKIIRSFSGASAGGINSLLSALELCQPTPNTTEYLLNNAFSNTWDLGLEALLAVDEDSEQASLLSREPLEKKVKDLAQRAQLPATQDCDLTITLSVTMMEPLGVTLPNSQQTITLQRFVAPIKVSAQKGQKIRFSNTQIGRDTALIGSLQDSLALRQKATLEQALIPGPFIQLKGDAQGNLPFDTIKQLAFASSAFPVAFQPVILDYCFTNRLSESWCQAHNHKSAVFSDGGLFNNSPIDLAKYFYQKDIRQTKNLAAKVIFINPDHYRAKQHSLEKNIPLNNKPGLWDYGKYLSASFNTATAEEFRRALLYFEGLPDKPLTITTRYHNVLADFHAHFGAFYATAFRHHDYLVGLYDGFYLLSHLKCAQSGAITQATQAQSNCVQTGVKHQIDQLSKTVKVNSTNKVNPSNPELTLSLNFIRYLFNSEFGEHYSQMTSNKNILIALNHAFSSPSRAEQKLSAQSFTQYLERFRGLLKTDFSDLSLEPYPEMSEIVHNFNTWSTQYLRKLYTNAIHMQQKAVAADQGQSRSKAFNRSIEFLLNFSQPFAGSQLSFMEQGTWPLSYQPSKYWSGSLLFGGDVHEKNLELALEARFPTVIIDHVSADFSIAYNRFGREFSHDHYWAASMGLTYHFDQLFFNTLGFGWDRGFSGKQLYKDKIDRIYLSTGVFNELFRFKLSHGVDELNSEFSGDSSMARDRTTFTLYFDITKLIDYIF